MDGVAPLVVDGVTLRFGGITALDEVKFTVEPGTIHALIGPNGAGKSSCFNVISGLYRPTAGTVRLGETELTALRPHQLAGLGVGRSFQNIALSPGSTVRDNLMLGRHHLTRGGFLACGPAAPAPAPSAATWPASRRSARSSASPTGSTRPSGRCPTASRSASTSPGRSPASPRCCCSTSPPRAWTPPRRPRWR